MTCVKKPFTGINKVLTGAALILCAVIAVPAHSQDFPPFPEPAVGPFPDTKNMKLLSQLLPAEIGAVTPRSGVLLNDIWGWTSPHGQEYALVGTGDGMAVVRVTNPRHPVFIGIMPTQEPASFANLWGDVAVYNVRYRARDDDDDDDADDDGDDDRKYHWWRPWFTGYAYFTTEAPGAGISILDLSQLDHFGPAPYDGFKIPRTSVFEQGGYDSAHNIYVNQKTGFAYVVGVELQGDNTACDGHEFHPSRFNTLILDLKKDPLNPEIVACLADFGEHDIYVVNYRGPDRDYRNREIAFVFDGRDKDTASRRGMRKDDTPGVRVGGTTEIWDVTDKNNIRVISSFTVPGICFSHQGWTSSRRHEFLLINDELDELRDAEPDDGTGFFRTEFCKTDKPGGTLSNPGIYVMNIRDLDNPRFQERFEVNSPGDNDHNFVREGDKLYWAVYNVGTRVIKMRKKWGRLRLREIARLDSEPRMVPEFNGQWGIFPLPRSRTIIASDIVNGLMVMRLNRRHYHYFDDRHDLSTSGAVGEAFDGSEAEASGSIAAQQRTTSEQQAATRARLVEYYKSRIRY